MVEIVGDSMTLFFRKLLLFFLFFETILFLMLYCFGPNGLHVLSGLTSQTHQIIQGIEELQQEVQQLHTKIAESKSDFAKEKIARERLLMKKENETVYFKS